MDTPFTEFVDIMERAARNGTKAHLPAEVVRAILLHPAWMSFLAERQAELVASWGAKLDNAPVAVLPASDPTAVAGPRSSAGRKYVSTDEQQDGVAAAERRLALAAMAAIKDRRRKPPPR